MNAFERNRSWGEISKIVFSDAGKLFIGLVISVVLALSLPRLAAYLGDTVAAAQAEQIRVLQDEADRSFDPDVAPEEAPADEVAPQ